MTSSPFPPGSSVIAYLRDSGGRAQGLSTIEQEASIRQYCQAHQITLVRTFADIARTGTTDVGRDQLKALVAHLEASSPHEIAGLIFYEYARLARDMDDGLFYLATIRRMGYQVHPIADQIPEGPFSKVLETLHLLTAEEYSRKLSTWVKRGQLHTARTYKAWNHGAAPIGYKKSYLQVETLRSGDIVTRDVPQLEIDPQTAPRVRRAFEMRAAGYSYAEINQETQLFEHRYSYYNLFRNPVYIGERHTQGSIITDFCPAIVDRATWDKVQQINADWQARRGYHHPRRMTSSFLLTGLIHCGSCGRAAYGYANPQPKRTYTYYRCNKNTDYVDQCQARQVPTGRVEKAVEEQLKKYLADPQYNAPLFREHIAYLKNTAQQHQDQVGQFKKRLATIERKTGRIVTAIEESGHNTALIARLAELDQQRIEATRALNALPPATAAHGPIPTVAQLQERSLELYRAYQAAGHRDKQRILRSIITRIEYVYSADGKLEIDITFALPAL